MGKPKKKQKKFQYNRNRRRIWKKRKHLPAVLCEQMKSEWDEKKSLQQNMTDMGLTSDSNNLIPMKKTKDALVPALCLDELETIHQNGKKTSVVAALEQEAQRPFDKVLWMAEPDVQLCVYMAHKYGDDYEAMARDAKNHYQETARQIKRKIQKFQKLQASTSVIETHERMQ